MLIMSFFVLIIYTSLKNAIKKDVKEDLNEFKKDMQELVMNWSNHND